MPWADKGSRFTKSFEQEVAWLAQRTDVSAVANYFRVTWRSVRRIIQRVVAEQRDERRELDGLRVIGMDEISYRKRHKYLTVVIDHLSGRVVWAGKERKAKTLLRFFRKLGPQRAAELEAVSMDMWEPYIRFESLDHGVGALPTVFREAGFQAGLSQEAIAGPVSFRGDFR